MPVVLTLGPLLFTDFEVPERIRVPIRQAMVKKRFIGGDRVIDVTGRDDDDISWSGRFRGSAAEIRSRLASFTCIQGQALELAWSTFRYLVLVSSFSLDFEQQYEIPYSISCTVLKDLTTPLLTSFLSLDAAISGDIAQVAQIGAQLGIPGVTDAITAVTTTTGGVETFSGAATGVVAGVQKAISFAMGVIATHMTGYNDTVKSAGGVAGAVGGISPAIIAQSITGQTDALSKMNLLSQAGALLGRAYKNVAGDTAADVPSVAWNPTT